MAQKRLRITFDDDKPNTFIYKFFNADGDMVDTGTFKWSEVVEYVDDPEMTLDDLGGGRYRGHAIRRERSEPPGGRE